MTPFVQEHTLLRETKRTILAKNTACERGIAYPDSQAVLYFISIFPRKRMQCVCYNGVKGHNAPCGGVGGEAPKVFTALNHKFLNPHVPRRDGIFREGDDNIAVRIQIEWRVGIDCFKLAQRINLIVALAIAEE